MTDLQILILTLFLGLFVLLINYLVKFFRSAVKSVEENQTNETEDENEISKQVCKLMRNSCIIWGNYFDLSDLYFYSKKTLLKVFLI